jgi:hypothetical protein
MDEDLPLRRRVPGAAGREAPASVRPVLAESVLLRMQAAIDAAKTDLEEQDRDPDTEPIPAISASRAKSAKEAKGAKTSGQGTPAADAPNGHAVKSARKPKRNLQAPQERTPTPDRLSAFTRRKREAQPQGVPDPESAAPPQALAPADSTPPQAPPRSPGTAPAQPPSGSAPRSPTGYVPPWPADEPERPVLPRRETPARPEVKADQAALPKRDAPARPDPKPEQAALPKRDAPARPDPKPEQAALPKRDAAARAGSAAIPSRAASAEPAGPPRPAPQPEQENRQERTAPPAQPAADRQPASAMRTPPDAPAEPESPTVRPRSAPSRGTTAPPGRSTQQQGRRQSSRGRRSTPRIVAAAVVVVAAAATAAFALAAQSPPARSHQLTRLQRAEARNQARAVAWVAAQVSPSTVVSCDPKTCTALAGQGHPSANVRPLRSTSVYPKDSAVVVETAEVRGIFGTSLNTLWAPYVLDTIGSGQAQVTIRVVAPDGSAAYQRQLKTDQAQRKEYGEALIGNSQIGTPKSVTTQLAAGQVDSRLLLAILAMGSSHPIAVVDFGNVATDASTDLPLRYADLAEHVPAAHLTDAAYVRAILSVLGTLPGNFRPLSTKRVSLPDGQVVLRIAYSAPSPLNLSMPGSPG